MLGPLDLVELVISHAAFCVGLCDGTHHRWPMHPHKHLGKEARPECSRNLDGPNAREH
jgi:hypothetical protein